MGRLIYSRSGEIVFEEESTSDEKNRVRYMMMLEDARLKKEYEYSIKHQCPTCHVVMPLTHICDSCQD
jgi:hypothetical protein